MGSRLDARLLDQGYDSESEDGDFGKDLEAGGGGKGEGDDEYSIPEHHRTVSRKIRSSKRGIGRMPSRARQESTRELVDFFAGRMQEARDAWATRVKALQKRWRASILSGDWGRLGGGRSAQADRDAALRLTFGLIVRMYAYEDALEDLRQAAVEEPSCLEFFVPQVCLFCRDKG